MKTNIINDNYAKKKNVINTELPKLFCRLVNMMQQTVHRSIAFTVAL
jgi:hypothetical protein